MGSSHSRKNTNVSVWKLSEFEKISTIVGETSFPYSSWGDFVTYSTPTGANGHITPHSLAKNYLEIGLSNMFREGLNLDHVCFKNNPDWTGKGFFMRYQEIQLSPEFYSELSCPRRTASQTKSSFLMIRSEVKQVGNTSMVAEQRLFSGDIEVGKNIMQLCCVDRTERKSTKFPKSFINHDEIYPLTEVPRPRFPLGFLTTNHKKLGDSKREVFISDTDENNHLNESGFLRFLFDAFYQITDSKNKSLRVKDIKALYKREIIATDIVRIELFHDDTSNTYAVNYYVDDNLAFTARFEFY